MSRPRLRPSADSSPSALTLVLAPAGYGQSTLISQWVSEGVFDPMVVHWVRCRPEPTAETLRLAAELERRLEAAQERDLAHIRTSLSVVYAILGFAGLMNGNAQMGERGFSRAYEAAVAAGSESEQIRGLSGLAMVAAMSGNVEEARSLNARAVELILSSGVSGPALAQINRQTANALVAVDDRNPLELQAILEPLEDALPSWDQAGVLVYAETQMLRMTEGPLAALRSLEKRVQRVKQARRFLASTPPRWKPVRVTMQTHSAP